MNQAIISGNVGRSEFKDLPSGDGILKFSVATSERYTDKEGKRQEQTEWHSCVMFGKRASALKNLIQKGAGVLVTGRIQYKKYTDKNGIEKHSTQITVDNVEIYKYSESTAKNANEKNQTGPAREQSPGPMPEFQPSFTEDDIPF